MTPRVPSSFARPVTFETFPELAARGWWFENQGRFLWNDRRRALEIAPDTGERRCSRPVQVGPHAGGRSLPGAPGADRQEKDSAAPLLSDLIGHDEAIACLRSAMRGASQYDEPLPPTLVSGPPGVGKTSLSHAVARELGVRLHKLHGSAIRDPGFLAGWLAGGGRHDIFFVDEMHAVPRELCEMMYEAIDGRCLTLPVIRGAESRTISIELEPLSLLGATTHLAEIPGPLRSRFQVVPLDLLEAADLEEILRRAATTYGLAIDPLAAHMLARASKGIPRQGLALLRHSRAVACGKPGIEEEDAARALRELGIDDRGLDRTDRKVIELLVQRGRAISQRGIAMMASLPLATYRDVVEPYLVQTGRIEVTPRGRVAARAT